MREINIIQFMPYFPPHKWWVETVWEEIGKYWCKSNFWEFINIITSFGQENNLKENEKIIFKWEVIWYKKDNYEVLVIPSFEIINNFPIYKFWTKKYKLINLYLNHKIAKNKNDFRVLTHTRFFLTSLFGWLFAKKNKIKWNHIEHWSDYVKLSSKLYSFISIIYDKLIWKWIFKKVDKIFAISEASKKFINNEFFNKEVNVFNRGFEFNRIFDKNNNSKIKLVFIWRLVKLKWVEDLIEAYKKTWIKVELVIIWDWEEKEYLIRKSNKLNVKFLWYKDKEFILNYLSKNKCILVNPSYQEWLPTTVIEWLSTKNVVVASNVWWTKEITSMKDLILFKSWDIHKLSLNIKSAIQNYDNLNWLSFDILKEKFDWNKCIIEFYKKIS